MIIFFLTGLFSFPLATLLLSGINIGHRDFQGVPGRVTFGYNAVPSDPTVNPPYVANPEDVKGSVVCLLCSRSNTEQKDITGMALTLQGQLDQIRTESPKAPI